MIPPLGYALEREVFKMGGIKQKIDSIAVKTLISYLDSDPENNIPRILQWLRHFDRDSPYTPMYEQVSKYLEDPSNNWNIFMKTIYSNSRIEPRVRKKLFGNFALNAGFLGKRQRTAVSEAEGCNVPWAILLDPTSACNLRCIGCWAAQYGQQFSLDYNLLDRIVAQGKQMGTFVYLFTGGEPLLRKDDIMKLCSSHGDCIFSAFTNGTLLDESFADRILEVGNFVPAISIEGFEEETDMRRGKGTYRAVLRAMDILRERRLPFGFSACYHRENTSVIGSEQFFDEMIDRGCLFGWLFTYMPVGRDAVPELMATAEQREFMYRRVREFRRTKPLFTLDFWNDGDYVEGCIAGGRCYLHINAAGDVEPCAFIHYADSNIKEKSLLEALKSPLFMEYRKHQPFSGNYFRPCPLLDNPGCLASMVHASGASSTEFSAPEDVDVLTSKCTRAAIAWAPVARRLAEEKLQGIPEPGTAETAAGKEKNL